MAIRVEPSGQKISWFKDRLSEECLVFKPPFQRNPVWLHKHKAYLADTVLRGLPVPEIYLQAETDTEGNTVYSIVDGQQRVRALLEFSHGDVTLIENYSPGRDGQSWEDLTADEKRRFWDYKLQTREIFDASDADLRDLFRRLNQHTVVLNAQELRNARFKGDFITTVTELADEDFWAESGIVRASEIRRMLDIEFMAELLVGIMHGPQNKKLGLDGFFQSYENGTPDKQRWLGRFETARATTAALVEDLARSRWSGRSDYYSLFLAVEELLEFKTLSKKGLLGARKVLRVFGASVTRRLSKAGASAKASRDVRQYALAVEKAASDRDRRVIRQRILTALLRPYFK
jgi:hypothetical protein